MFTKRKSKTQNWSPKRERKAIKREERGKGKKGKCTRTRWKAERGTRNGAKNEQRAGDSRSACALPTGQREHVSDPRFNSNNDELVVMCVRTRCQPPANCMSIAYEVCKAKITCSTVARRVGNTWTRSKKGPPRPRWIWQRPATCPSLSKGYSPFHPTSWRTFMGSYFLRPRNTTIALHLLSSINFFRFYFISSPCYTSYIFILKLKIYVLFF